MQKYGIGYEQLMAGEYKDIGTPFRNMTKEEHAILQERLDLMHEYFIEQVSQNRNLHITKTREAANGLFYTGKQAKDLGLVDELGGEDVAVEQIKILANLTDVSLVPYVTQRSFWDIFGKALSHQSFAVGQGIGHEIVSGNSDFTVRK